MDNNKTWIERFDEEFLDGKASMFGNQVPCIWSNKESIKQFISEERKALIEEIKELVAITFARSPLQNRKDSDSDKFYLEILDKLELLNNKER